MGGRLAWVTGRVPAVAVLVLGFGVAALTFATSPSQPAASPTQGLPTNAQSTRVTELAERFASEQNAPAVVVFERLDGPLTEADRAAISRMQGVLTPGAPVPPSTSEDGQAALVVVPITGSDDSARFEGVDRVRAAIRGGASQLPTGLATYVTGGPAFGRDIAAAFDGADVTLLLATVVVVAILLLVTYRSPILWLVPLLVIGVADQIVTSTLPWLGRLLGERTDAAVAGIVSVLVFGAGTDYALLLISRYREELRRTASRRTAMAGALRSAGPAIVASAATVILALLTMLAAVQPGNRTLGLAAAYGVLVALVFGVVVLPAALVCLPRAVFWPFVPRLGSADPSEGGFWSRVARLVSRRPAAVLVAGTLVLAGLSAGLLNTSIGLSQTEQFRTTVESVEGQQALARHFPAGAAQPVAIVARAGSSDDVVAAADRLAGVASVSDGEQSTDGELVKVDVELSAASGTPEADDTIRALRAAVAAIPRAEAIVGGQPAADLDQRDANIRDNLVVVPLVLVVVMLVLIAVLRSLMAPVLLLLTVIVSFAASVGAATIVLQQVFGIPGLDGTVPLLSFLFLVALGVDYNIFLVSRAREEAAGRGSTRAAMSRALAATGGVITSAGVLLAAVFAVLGVLPVIALTQIGVIVGIGVLIDTLLVRTVIVPALALLLGERFWWPAKPARSAAIGPDMHAATADRSMSRF
jgi:RND superfamily putative drug exporter